MRLLIFKISAFTSDNFSSGERECKEALNGQIPPALETLKVATAKVDRGLK